MREENREKDESKRIVYEELEEFAAGKDPRAFTRSVGAGSHGVVGAGEEPAQS
jgi:hypothetical protein